MKLHCSYKFSLISERKTDSVFLHPSIEKVKEAHDNTDPIHTYLEVLQSSYAPHIFTLFFIVQLSKTIPKKVCTDSADDLR